MMNFTNRTTSFDPTFDFEERRRAHGVDGSAPEDNGQAAEIFRDPVSYLASYGITATLIEATHLPTAA